VFLIFFGEFRLAQRYEAARDAFRHVIETPRMMRVPIITLAVLSVGVFFHWNPFAGEQSWLMSVIRVPASVAPGAWYGSGWTDSLYAIGQEKHVLVAVISTTLALAGIVLGWLFYNPGPHQQLITKIQRSYFSEGTPLNKLSLHNWYMDAIYDKGIVQPVVALSRGCAWFDKRVIDRVVDLTGIITVVKAHVIAWIDRTVVDGAVHFIARMAGFTGRLARSMHGGNVQQYFVLTLLSLLIIFILVLL
jgi:NADH-quinone oxidoreductase subunit L